MKPYKHIFFHSVTGDQEVRLSLHICENNASWQSAISQHIGRFHEDIIKWKHFPCYWPFVQGIHQSLVNSPNKGQWRGALMFSLICAWINGWLNNCEAGYLRCHRVHYDVIVMSWSVTQCGCHNGQCNHGISSLSILYLARESTMNYSNILMG